MSSPKNESILWARRMVETQPLILDTETTGLQAGEIVQISVVDFSGQVLLDTLVKPWMPIPPSATNIHGITNRMVDNAKTWDLVVEQVIACISFRDVVIYNASFDVRMLNQSSSLRDLPYDFNGIARFQCAMHQYARFYGEWNGYRGSYVWQALTKACYQEGLPEPEERAHSALGDCLRTLSLVQAMANTELS